MTESQGTLLIVDDEELNRDMLSRRLAAEGYETVCAASGAEALELIGQRGFDLVLLDVMMPEQDGYEVLSIIRQTRSVLELPVLMVTAKNQNEDVVNAFSAGANDYLTKPVNFPVALARIGAHLSSKRLSSNLRDSETRYALSAQGANDGLWDWDFVTNQIHYSDRWKTMLGYQPDEVSAAPQEWFDRVHPDDQAHVQKALTAHRMRQTEQFESEHRMQCKDGSFCWVLTRGAAIWDVAGRETRMAGSQTDITRGKAADSLTGLPNRVLFMDHLDGALQQAGGRCGYCAVLFLDVDRFKVVNDSLGHHAGDELLVTLADRLETCLRSTDVISRVTDRSTVARFGGDEFVILLKGLRDPDCASHVADRILAALAEPTAIAGHDMTLSASIGIAVADVDQTSAEDLVRDADTAMYHAKRHGKGRWTMFDPSLRAQAVERLLLESDLKRGIERQQFCLNYQPIVSLGQKRIEGFEALVRWQHQTRGNISPVDFIPLAEETGFIIPLGAWILEQACRQLGQWQSQRPDEPPLFMSVNVSSKQFGDPSFVGTVTRCMQQYQLAPGTLKLEITETAIMADPTSAMRMLEELRELGVHISLDDFGTGYSSLSYLQQFPIDTLKIDRSFIERLGESCEAREIVKTIIKLAHSLGMQVTAEGVEERVDHSTLLGLDCESGQGYLYSRPMSASSADRLLAESEGETLEALLQEPQRHAALSGSR